MSDWTADTRLVRAFRPASAPPPVGGHSGTAGGARRSTVTRGTAPRWPATVPAAAQLLREGLELTPGITVLVGENGSGKSTVVEMLAEAYGLNPQGGSILAPAVRVRETEPRAGNVLLFSTEKLVEELLGVSVRHSGPAIADGDARAVARTRDTDLER